MSSLTPQEYQYFIDTGNPPPGVLKGLTNSLAVQKFDQSKSQFEQQQALAEQKAADANTRFYAALAKRKASGGSNSKNFDPKNYTTVQEVDPGTGEITRTRYQPKIPGMPIFFVSADGKQVVEQKSEIAPAGTPPPTPGSIKSPVKSTTRRTFGTKP